MPAWLLTVRGRVLLGAVLLAGLFTFIAAALPWGRNGPTLVASLFDLPASAGPPAVLVGAAVLAFMLSAAALLSTMSAQTVISVEGGGVRWRRGAGGGYVAYGALRDARLAPVPGLNRVALALTTADGGVIRLALDDVRPEALLREVHQHMLAQRRAEPPRTDVAVLARGDRDLATWLAAVRSATTATHAADAFRAAPVDIDALERTMTDDEADQDLRAAAAHALLASGDEERVQRVAQAIGAGAPPIVVAAAAMATAGRVRLAKEVIEDAMRFLTASDRKAVTAARSSTEQLTELDAVGAVGGESGADRVEPVGR